MFPVRLGTNPSGSREEQHRCDDTLREVSACGVSEIPVRVTKKFRQAKCLSIFLFKPQGLVCNHSLPCMELPLGVSPFRLDYIPLMRITCTANAVIFLCRGSHRRWETASPPVRVTFLASSLTLRRTVWRISPPPNTQNNVSHKKTIVYHKKTIVASIGGY